MLELNKTAKVVLALAMPTSVMLLYWWYTRVAEDDEESFGKQVATSKYTKIEVKVPRKAVGTVIGKQGSNIKQVQKITGARLHFTDNDSDTASFRNLVIHGSWEAAQQAELIILQTIADVPEVLTEEIEVPQTAIGRIIGKGGCSIREIYQISGARVDISRSENTSMQTGSIQYKSIKLKGTRDEIDKAVELIEEKVEQDAESQTAQAIKAGNREVRKNQKAAVKLTPVAVDEDNMWDEQKKTDLPTLSTEILLENEDSYVQIYVSAVEHPGHFWVQVIGKKSLLLEQLQEDITIFACSDKARKGFAVKKAIPGEMVAAQFEDGERTYYRAEVLGELPDGKVDLYFVDFGDNTAASMKNIFKLRSDFLSLPRQAIECQLADVLPAGGKWSDEGITLFEDLAYCAQWKPIFAKTVNYGGGDGKTLRPHMLLIDTSGPRDVNIGQELIKQGFAVPSKSS